MPKILSLSICLALSVTLAHSYRYDLQILMSDAEQFPPVNGSFNLMVFTDILDYELSRMETTTIQSGASYFYTIILSAEVEKITKAWFYWLASDSNVQTPIYLNQLNLIPIYIDDDVKRTNTRKQLCPPNQKVHHNKQAKLVDCKRKLS